MLKMKRQQRQQGVERWLRISIMIAVAILVAGFAWGPILAVGVKEIAVDAAHNPVEGFLHDTIPYIAGAIEIVGVAIILYGCIAALFLFFRSHLDFNSTEVKLELAQALALSLEFKLAAEILKSVVVRTLEELILLAAIVALRVVMTVLIHWEIETSAADGDVKHYRSHTSGNTLSERLKQGKKPAPAEEADPNERGYIYKRTSVSPRDELSHMVEPRSVTRGEDGLTVTIKRTMGKLFTDSKKRARRTNGSSKRPRA